MRHLHHNDATYASNNCDPRLHDDQEANETSVIFSNNTEAKDTVDENIWLYRIFNEY